MYANFPGFPEFPRVEPFASDDFCKISDYIVLRLVQDDLHYATSMSWQKCSSNGENDVVAELSGNNDVTPSQTDDCGTEYFLEDSQDLAPALAKNEDGHWDNDQVLFLNMTPTVNMQYGGNKVRIVAVECVV